MKTLDAILNHTTSGVFVNDKGEYLTISTYWDIGTEKIRIVFAKPGEVAQKFAITTTSEKKCVSLIAEGGFQLLPSHAQITNF